MFHSEGNHHLTVLAFTIKIPTKIIKRDEDEDRCKIRSQIMYNKRSNIFNAGQYGKVPNLNKAVFCTVCFCITICSGKKIMAKSKI